MPLELTWSHAMLDAPDAIELSSDEAPDTIEETSLAIELVPGSLALALAPALALTSVEVDAPTLTPPTDAEADPPSWPLAAVEAVV